MKKILSVVLTLCFAANISFAAFDPYADEEIEKKSYKKLYYGIVLTLLGGFLVYDGFSKVEDDVSRPSVDYTTVLHSEWVKNGSAPSEHDYTLRSGTSPERYSPNDPPPDKTNPIYVEENVLYNNGNVDLHNVIIEVRYNNKLGQYIVDNYSPQHPDNGAYTSDGYHCASCVDGETSSGKTVAIIESLKKGEHVTWHDVWEYRTDDTSVNPKTGESNSSPSGAAREINETADNPKGLYLGKDAIGLMTIRVKLNKNQQYKPIYHKRNKCDAEGVAGILVGLTGIYFIVDHFLDMHKFNAYAKRHQLNLKVATASNEYKLMLQKRI